MRTLFLLLMLIGIGCKSSDQNKAIEENGLNAQVKKKLLEWKLNSYTSTSIKDGNLNLAIHYKKDVSNTVNSFYLDKESNDLIINMISYFFYDSLKKYQNVDFQLTFEGYPDKISVSFDRVELTKRQNEFDQVPIFYEFVEYALVNMQYMGVLQATQLMRYLEKNTNVFDHKGSFWNLLYDYSKACNDKSQSLYSAYQFIWFTGVAYDPEMDDASSNFKSSLSHFVESCGFNQELTKLKPGELIEKLKSEYTK